ncbi:ABC transporter permease [Sediminitomix flava]|uniref:Peptide/nickel transport system permease protein n=1 Tax=Sediminitomix flava TaxID=379075 RepID=A0A315ZAQ3_SEDFL|nr:ABC transporter permease [Sediminitomix flava]PWJ42372.1 peptide/nickel transport system permease protein [Sediminitomix flava]
MQQNDIPKKTGLRRKFSNSGFIALVLVMFTFLIGLFGYLIMPDPTPFANDGMIEVAKKRSGFTVPIIKVRKDVPVEMQNFWDKLLYGQESNFVSIPYQGELILENDSVFYQLYDSHEKEIGSYKTKIYGLPLIRVVKSVYVGESDKLGKSISQNYVFLKEKVVYLDENESRAIISKEELEALFWKENVSTKTFIFGTDKNGRDILSRLIYGARISFLVGLIAVIISLIVGVTLGGISGYFGGVLDRFISWFMTVMWAIPTILLVIAIRLVFDSSELWVTFIAVGLTMWVEIARVVRGKVLELKEKTYIEAAHSLGYSDLRIITKHILPNLVGVLVVLSASNFASAILMEAGLSFLGLGGPPAMPSWGNMIRSGLSELRPNGEWHLILYPSICISLLVLSFNLLGNAIRDVLDPGDLQGR